jgi:hypothetical protein
MPAIKIVLPLRQNSTRVEVFFGTWRFTTAQTL